MLSASHPMSLLIAVSTCGPYSWGVYSQVRDAMKRRALLARVAAFAVGLCGLARAADQTVKGGAAAEAPKFVRLKRTEDKRPAAMQTAVVSYQSPKHPGVEVDLVGAVHIGDK